MNPLEPSISLCRHCRYYIPEGRRGGQCQKLNVAVKSQWNACSVADAPFLPPWNWLGDIMIWQQKALEVQEAVEASSLCKDVDSPEVISRPMPQPLGVEVSVSSS